MKRQPSNLECIAATILICERSSFFFFDIVLGTMKLQWTNIYILSLRMQSFECCWYLGRWSLWRRHMHFKMLPDFFFFFACIMAFDVGWLIYGIDCMNMPNRMHLIGNEFVSISSVAFRIILFVRHTYTKLTISELRSISNAEFAALISFKHIFYIKSVRIVWISSAMRLHK